MSEHWIPLWSSFYSQEGITPEQEGAKETLYDAMESFDIGMLGELLEAVKSKQKQLAKQISKSDTFVPGQIAFEDVTDYRIKGAKKMVLPVVVIKVNARTVTCFNPWPRMHFSTLNTYLNTPAQWSLRNWMHSANVKTEKVSSMIPAGAQIVRRRKQYGVPKKVTFDTIDNVLTPIDKKGEPCWYSSTDYQNSGVWTMKRLKTAIEWIENNRFSTNHKQNGLFGSCTKNFDWGLMAGMKNMIMLELQSALKGCTIQGTPYVPSEYEKGLKKLTDNLYSDWGASQ